MRVLHLTDDLQGISGVRSYLEGLAEAMAPMGIQCEMETLGTPAPGPRDGLSRWASSNYYSSMAERLRRPPKPDLVHAHNLWMRLSPTPLLAARRAGIPVVMTVHDYHLVCPRKWMITSRGEPCRTGFGPRCLVSNCRGSHDGLAWIPYNDLRWLKVALHRHLLRRWVDRFIAPSQHLANWLEKSLGLHTVVTIPNFTGEPEVTLPPPPHEPSSILYAGRLAREKGVDILIEAMAIVLKHKPGTVLTIVGDGPARGPLEKLARESLPPGSCRFTGSLSATGLGRRFDTSSLLVLPTLWMENCPIAVLEAMARGRPVVATRIGGLPELVEDGVTGALFERGNPSDLAERIVHLISNDETPRLTGQASAERHRRMYSPVVHAERLARVYHDLVNDGMTP